MSDPEWLAEVQRWLRYAREDLTAADLMLLQQMRLLLSNKHVRCGNPYVLIWFVTTSLWMI